MASLISISLVKLFPIKISMETACQCPFSSTFMISGLTLIKSVYGLNIPFVKIETTSTYSAVLSWLDFVGFLVTSALYRIGALILFWGYFNVSAIIPMIAIFLLGICVNSKTLFLIGFWFSWTYSYQFISQLRPMKTSLKFNRRTWSGKHGTAQSSMDWLWSY